MVRAHFRCSAPTLAVSLSLALTLVTGTVAGRRPASTIAYPACGATYTTIRDEYGYDYESDYTIPVCSKLPSAWRVLRTSVNPTIVKTDGDISATISGFPMVGGRYESSFVAAKAKVPVVYVPNGADGPDIITTDDGDTTIILLCTSIMKQAGYLFPMGMYVFGSTTVNPTGSVQTTCQTKWGQDPNGRMLAGKTYAELLEVAKDFYATHPDEKPPHSYREFQRHAALNGAAVVPDNAALAAAAGAAAAESAAGSADAGTAAPVAAEAPAGEQASSDPPLGPP